MKTPRIFLLSPAKCSGARAALLLSDRAQFPLARRVRRGEAAIGEVFSFVSGLYFRGKITYALTFARPPGRRNRPTDGVWVITTSDGLVAADTLVSRHDLRRFAAIDLSTANEAYTAPLEKTAAQIEGALGRTGDVVLLGSIASPKYVDVLIKVFARRLLFPTDFVGRGDMSRGGLLLRSARAGSELPYGPVQGAVRHGRRPPKLAPLPRRAEGAAVIDGAKLAPWPR